MSAVRFRHRPPGFAAGAGRVERTRETFRVTWDIGTQTFVGTGIGRTYTGGQVIGGEAWIRQ